MGSLSKMLISGTLNTIVKASHFDKVRYEIMLSGAETFQNEPQKLAFISALNAQHAMCSFKDSIAHCVPQLVDGYQKRKSKSRQRSITGHKQKTESLKVIFTVDWRKGQAAELSQ